jgi:hypothetical protein
MVKIYGCGDDLCEIENSIYKDDEIGCYENDVRIRFTDGTIIRIGYNKPGLGIWYIIVEKAGTANQKLTICTDEDDKPYSDIFEIDAEIKSHSIVKQMQFKAG